MLIKVDKFYFPVDFLVLDMEPVRNPSSQIPVILGRPFLATANATINCRLGTMVLTFGNMKVEMNVFTTLSPTKGDEMNCFMINALEDLVEEDPTHTSPIIDPLEACLAYFAGEDFEVNEHVMEGVYLLLEPTLPNEPLPRTLSDESFATHPSLLDTSTPLVSTYSPMNLEDLEDKFEKFLRDIEGVECEDTLVESPVDVALSLSPDPFCHSSVPLFSDLVDVTPIPFPPIPLCHAYEDPFLNFVDRMDCVNACGDMFLRTLRRFPSALASLGFLSPSHFCSFHARFPSCAIVLTRDQCFSLGFWYPLAFHSIWASEYGSYDIAKIF